MVAHLPGPGLVHPDRLHRDSEGLLQAWLDNIFFIETGNHYLSQIHFFKTYNSPCLGVDGGLDFNSRQFRKNFIKIVLNFLIHTHTNTKTTKRKNIYGCRLQLPSDDHNGDQLQARGLSLPEWSTLIGRNVSRYCALIGAVC